MRRSTVPRSIVVIILTESLRLKAGSFSTRVIGELIKLGRVISTQPVQAS